MFYQMEALKQRADGSSDQAGVDDNLLVSWSGVRMFAWTRA